MKYLYGVKHEYSRPYTEYSGCVAKISKSDMTVVKNEGEIMRNNDSMSAFTHLKANYRDAKLYHFLKLENVISNIIFCFTFNVKYTKSYTMLRGKF